MQFLPRPIPTPRRRYRIGLLYLRDLQIGQHHHLRRRVFRHRTRSCRWGRRRNREQRVRHTRLRCLDLLAHAMHALEATLPDLLYHGQIPDLFHRQLCSPLRPNNRLGDHPFWEPKSRTRALALLCCVETRLSRLEPIKPVYGSCLTPCGHKCQRGSLSMAAKTTRASLQRLLFPLRRTTQERCLDISGSAHFQGTSFVSTLRRCRLSIAVFRRQNRWRSPISVASAEAFFRKTVAVPFILLLTMVYSLFGVVLEARARSACEKIRLSKDMEPVRPFRCRRANHELGVFLPNAP